jgi:hypothetical protein
MGDPIVGNSSARSRILNAIALQNAVLCAECDVVSDSPHDVCLVCGSRSLFNVARIFGGALPQKRARLVTGPQACASRDGVLVFPKPHEPRRRATAARQPAIAALGDNAAQQELEMLVAPQGD